MVKWLMRRAITAFERQWNYDARYLHEISEASPRAAWMFSRAAAIGKYRKDVPVAAWTAAAITAVRHEDCGPCTQLGVSMAERAGVDAKVLRAVLTEDPAAMPDDAALAWRFTRATLDHDPAADRYREEIVKRPLIILLDLNMPMMNGLEFLEVVKGDTDLRDIPVIILTSSKNEEDVAKAYDGQVAGYMTKPVAVESLIEKMAALGRYWTLCEIP